MMENETLRIIKGRRSVRNYAPEQIRDEELKAVLEAGLYAPNAGDQAWHFTVVQNPGMLERLNNAAKEAAANMDMPHLAALGRNESFHCLYHAPTLVIVSGVGSAPMPLDADCAAATENLLIAAESVGLSSCWIYFILLAFHSGQGPQLLRELQIPSGYKPYSAAIFGYNGGKTAEAAERKAGLINYIR